MNYPAAIQRPTSKHGYGNDDVHLNLGAVVHSMEGSLAAAFGELDNPQRPASWHFSVAITGAVYQHVDTANIVWTSGSYNANKRFWGIECEGVAGDPIDGAQLDALVALLAWLFDNHGITSYVRKDTLWEHNEMVIFGSAATACPSGRVPWAQIIQRLSAGREPAPPGTEDDLTPEEHQMLADAKRFAEAAFGKANEVWEATFGNQRDSIPKQQHRAIQADVDAIQASLGGGTVTLSQADIERIATAVVNKEAERLKA